MVTREQAARNLYNKVFGKPQNKISQILRDISIKQTVGSGGVKVIRSGGGGGGMSVFDAKGEAEAARISAEKRAAEEATRKAAERAKAAAEEVAKKKQDQHLAKLLNRKNSTELLIRSKSQYMDKPKNFSELISRIVPPEVRSDFEKKVGRLDELTEKQQKFLDEYRKIKPLTPQEKKKLGPIGTIKEQQRRGLERSKVKGLTVKEKLELFTGGLQEAITNGLTGIADLPKTASYLKKNPSKIKEIPSDLWTSTKNFSKVAQISPQRAVGRIGGEVVLFYGSGKAIEAVGRLSEKQVTKLLPKYVGEAKVGKKLKIPVGSGELVELDVVGKIPKELIKKQIKRSGSRLEKATSSQADSLIGLIKREQIVKKPLGKTKSGISIEKALSKEGKMRLRRLDAGKITRLQLIRLDEEIRKLGAKGILERSFFADPSGKIRPSRLGVKTESATLKDYLSGNISFRKSKPQILLFRNLDIEKFPNNLRPIVNKLFSGKKISASENAKLLEFQLKKSGKFKPLGFASKESEITLAPGEIIKKVKKRGTTLINGRKVPIIEVEPYKPKGKIMRSLNDLRSGKLKGKEVSKLDKLLKRETGLDYKVKRSLSSSKYSSGKYINLRRLSLNALSRSISKFKPSVSSRRKLSVSKSKPSKSRRNAPLSKNRRSQGYSAAKFITSKTHGRYKTSYPKKSIKSNRSPARLSSRTRKSGKSKIAIPLGRIRRVAKERVVNGYEIEVKSRGKFIKASKLPLTKKDALNRLAFVLDNSTSRTARIIPARKVRNVGTVKIKEKGYYNRTRSKLRGYRIVKGKKKALGRTLIEKRRYGIDTKGEKKQLTAARLIKNEKFLGRKKRSKPSRSKRKK